MNKDYEPSTNFSQEIMESLNMNYLYRDLCADFQVEYLSCQRQNPIFIENTLVYSTPIVNKVASCMNKQKQWKACQNYREKEIFEEMRKVYLQRLQQQQVGIELGRFDQSNTQK